MIHMKLTQQGLQFNTILVLTAQEVKEIKTGARKKIKTEEQQSEKHTLKRSIIVSSSKGQIKKRNSNPV